MKYLELQRISNGWLATHAMVTTMRYVYPDQNDVIAIAHEVEQAQVPRKAAELPTEVPHDEIEAECSVKRKC